MSLCTVSKGKGFALFVSGALGKKYPFWSIRRSNECSGIHSPIVKLGLEL